MAKNYGFFNYTGSGTPFRSDSGMIQKLLLHFLFINILFNYVLNFVIKILIKGYSPLL